VLNVASKREKTAASGGLWRVTSSQPGDGGSYAIGAITTGSRRDSRRGGLGIVDGSDSSSSSPSPSVLGASKLRIAGERGKAMMVGSEFGTLLCREQCPYLPRVTHPPAKTAQRSIDSERASMSHQRVSDACANVGVRLREHGFFESRELVHVLPKRGGARSLSLLSSLGKHPWLLVSDPFLSLRFLP
jgi:hypothetical protein